MPTLLAALGYVLLTVLLTYPVSVAPATRALAVDADANLFLWTLGWDVHALVSQPLSIFDANIYYPERLTLAYSENLLGSAIVAAPVIWLTANPVLAVNVVALLSCVLCGLGTGCVGMQECDRCLDLIRTQGSIGRRCQHLSPTAPESDRRVPRTLS